MYALSVLNCLGPDMGCVKDVVSSKDRSLIDEYFTTVLHARCIPVDPNKALKTVSIDERDENTLVIRAEYEDGGSSCTVIEQRAGQFYCYPC